MVGATGQHLLNNLHGDSQLYVLLYGIAYDVALGILSDSLDDMYVTLLNHTD